MTKYPHTKGHIQDNAIVALLNDPLFRQRVERNAKEKGSYRRGGKHAKGISWETSGKLSGDNLPLVFKFYGIKKAILERWLFLCQI